MRRRATSAPGVEGTYALTDSGDGTRLAIELGVDVDLPFPRLAKPAVQASMQAVIAAMGVGFARNLERQLSARLSQSAQEPGYGAGRAAATPAVAAVHG